METIWHVACLGTDDLQKLLQESQIQYEREKELSSLLGWIYFDVSEQNPAFLHIRELCGEDGEDAVLTYKVRFTSNELQAARWLVFESLTEKIDLVREDITFSCAEIIEGGKAYHRYLSGKPFYVSKPPKHTKQQHFFSSSAATSCLFCTTHAKKILEEFSSAVKYEPVLQSSTGLPIGDLFYMNFQETIPKAAIDVTGVEETFICPVCQRQTYLPPIQLRIDKKYFSDSVDFYKTDCIFSCGGNLAFCMNIVSQRGYQAIIKKALHRGLEFTPVQLV